MSDPASSDRRLSTLGTLGGLLTVTGFGLPVRWGWAVPCLLVVVAWFALEVRYRRRAAGRIALERAWWGHKLALSSMLLLVTVVFVAVAAGGVASLLVAFPAAWWSCGAALAFGGVASFVRGPRVRGPVMMLGASLVALAAVVGARWEAGGADARGWAYSGPIHGIHPFQTTAIIVDGYGPFDLPINDYVEPDGSKGYSPTELAEAIERALHRIAEVHFADGPARAAMAFGQAETGSVVDPPIRERLDHEPPSSSAPRFFVRSGTWGQRSSVAFVCPGRTDHPRGDTSDNVMNRMCPSKYAAEGSAGLGLTGRWPGYAEGRGNERAGISRWMGWTRSDDAEGHAVVRKELLATIAASLLVPIALLAGGRRTGGALHTFVSLGGMVAALGLGLAVVGVFAATPSEIELPALDLRSGRPGGSPWTLAAWMPALVVFLGSVLGDGFDDEPPVARARVWGQRLGLAAVLVVTAGIAAHLGALHWMEPIRGSNPAGELAWVRWVGGVAEAVGPRAGLNILEIEAVVAGAATVLLLTLVTHAVKTLVGMPAALGWTGPRWRGRSLAPVLVLGAAIAMVLALAVSRKTEGGSALVEAAVGLGLVLSSSLHLRGRVDRPGPLSLAAISHLGWIAIAAYAVVHSALATAHPTHPFVIGCAAAGLASTATALSFLRHRSPRA